MKEKYLISQYLLKQAKMFWEKHEEKTYILQAYEMLLLLSKQGQTFWT